MIRFLSKRRARTAGFLAVSTAMLAVTTSAMLPAHADPISRTAYVGVGSDTIQDVMNALAGAAPYVPPAGITPTFYTPATGMLVSSAATGSKTVVSWDAVDPANGSTTSCITPKLGLPSIDRPNGSGDGQKALSRAIDAGSWTKGFGCGSGAGNVTGSVDFARSSSGPPSAFPGTVLSFIPFSRDGVSYAFVQHGTGDISALTSANLKTLYGTGGVASSGTLTLGNGDTVFACMVQGGSGTGKFWDKAMGNDGTGTTSHTSAVNSGCNASVDYEENGYNSFLASAFVTGLTATQDAVIPFSAGSWISQANGVANDRSANGRSGTDKIGAIDAVSPITGTAPSESPNSTYYASTTYGRDLYIVVPTSKVPNIGGDAGLKSLFKGPASAICSAASQTLINKFGFSSATAKPCGTTGDATLQSGLVS
jgi:hypothetical protein